MINDCQKCEDFDVETKELVGKFLSQDEAYYITLLIAGGIHGQKKGLAAPTLSKRQRMQVMSTISFLEQLVGKMLVSLNPQYLKRMTEELEQAKVRLNIQHGPCPHKS